MQPLQRVGSPRRRRRGRAASSRATAPRRSPASCCRRRRHDRRPARRVAAGPADAEDADDALTSSSAAAPSYDGTGAPGRVADVAITDGVDRARSAPDLDGDARARRVGLRRSRPASSTSTRTTTRRCSGTRRCGRRRTTASRRSWPATAASRSRRRAPSTTTSIVRTLENVEDMDPATLLAGIEWDFETFPEYLDAVAPARDATSTSPRTSGTRRCGST